MGSIPILDESGNSKTSDVKLDSTTSAEVVRNIVSEDNGGSSEEKAPKSVMMTVEKSVNIADDISKISEEESEMTDEESIVTDVESGKMSVDRGKKISELVSSIVVAGGMDVIVSSCVALVSRMTVGETLKSDMKMLRPLSDIETSAVATIVMETLSSEVGSGANLSSEPDTNDVNISSEEDRRKSEVMSGEIDRTDESMMSILLVGSKMNVSKVLKGEENKEGNEAVTKTLDDSNNTSSLVSVREDERSKENRAVDGSITTKLGVVTGVGVVNIVSVISVSTSDKLADSDIMIDGVKMLAPTVSSEEGIGWSREIEDASKNEDKVDKTNTSSVDITKMSLVNRPGSDITEELILESRSDVSIPSIVENGMTKKSEVIDESSRANVEISSAEDERISEKTSSTRLDVTKVEMKGVVAANVRVVSATTDTRDDSSGMRSMEDDSN